MRKRRHLVALLMTTVPEDASDAAARICARAVTVRTGRRPSGGCEKTACRRRIPQQHVARLPLRLALRHTLTGSDGATLYLAYRRTFPAMKPV